MSIFVLSDLHFSFGIKDKEMDVFGANWKHHADKIKNHWLKSVKTDDLVLIPGDISWGMHPADAKSDLDWVDAMPGTKVMIRGNHDYWWSSLKKLEKILPPSIHLIQNNIFKWKNIAIGGARLWDTPEYSFAPYINYKSNPRENTLTKIEDPKEAEKIFLRELGRLEMSLKQLPQDDTIKLAMTHYPPIGADSKSSRVSAILEKYKISICVFGHLHNVIPDSLPFGTKNGVKYLLTSCDYLDFCPKQIL